MARHLITSAIPISTGSNTLETLSGASFPPIYLHATNAHVVTKFCFCAPRTNTAHPLNWRLLRRANPLPNTAQKCMKFSPRLQMDLDYPLIILDDPQARKTKA